MYERSYGARYDEARGLTMAQTAALIRRDIKAAVNAGDLPELNYSVRSSVFSGGGSIDVEVRDWLQAWQDCTGIVPGSEDGYSARACPQSQYHGEHATCGHKVLTVEAQRVMAALKAIHGAYNHDGSEIMVDYFDVNYYGQVSIEDEWDADARARERERKAARKAARV